MDQQRETEASNTLPAIGPELPDYVYETRTLELEGGLTLFEVHPGALNLLMEKAKLVVEGRVLNIFDLKVVDDIMYFYEGIAESLTLGEILVNAPDGMDSRTIFEYIGSKLVQLIGSDAIADAEEIDNELRRDLERQLAEARALIPADVANMSIRLAWYEDQVGVRDDTIAGLRRQITLLQQQKADLQDPERALVEAQQDSGDILIDRPDVTPEKRTLVVRMLSFAALIRH